jgi:acetyl esterase/lipase
VSGRKRWWRALVPGASVLALGVVLTSCGGSPSLAGTPSTVTYCTNGGVDLAVQIYHPADVPKNPVPVVVYFHGGGWQQGVPFIAAGTQFGDVETSIVNHGWYFATVQYRLAPEWRWPAQIVDAKCAIRYLRASAGFLHIDPSRIGVIGDSAGGQLAAMIGLAPPLAGFDVGQYADQSSRVAAVVDEYGPTDLAAPDWLSSPIASQTDQAVFGVPPGGDTAPLVAASPVTYVAPGAPPFLVIQGAADQIVPPSQSVELVRRLVAAQDQAKLVLVQGAGHGLVPAGSEEMSLDLAAAGSEVASFFFTQLGQPGR